MSDFFENYESPNFMLRSKATKHSLKFELWNGNLSMNVWDPENTSKGPVFKKSLPDDMVTRIKMEIKDLISAGPDTKKTIVVSAWDRDEKKYKPNYVMSLIKNGEQIIQLQLTHGGNGQEQSYLFDFMAAAGISRGSEAEDNGTKSKVKVLTFLDWLNKELPIGKCLTRKKFKRQNPQQSSGGGGTSSGGGNGGDTSFF